MAMIQRRSEEGSMRGRLLRTKVGAAAVATLAAGLILVAGAGRAAATVITAFPVDFSVAEQSAFNGAVATFEDDNPAATPSDFTASIDWGDGSPTTAGTIASSSAAFVVLGQHTYADEGSFTVTVTIADQSPGTGTATATDTATVTEADALSGSPVVFSAPTGVSFTTTVATFSDTLTSAVPGDFTATIDWGDATTSAGTVSGGGGSFTVKGTHTYAGAGTFSVVVTLSDDAPGTATATVTSTAHVASGLSVTAVNFSVAEHAAFNGTVATFSDSDTTRTPAGFTSSINWGDGTAPTAGTITGGAGSFTVSGQHTYADERTATVTVTVSETASPMRTDTKTGTATVTEADVLTPGAPVNFSTVVGTPFTGTVATFTDTDTVSPVGDFAAVINWGDASTSAGTVTGGGGSFTVSGTHTYTTAGNFSVTVTLTDDPPGTATATVTSTAHVATAPPTLSKAFGAGSIFTNSTTTLTFTLSNPNSGASLTGVGFTDTLPAGLLVATPNGLTGSCGGGTITAVAGSSSVSLTGATLPASGSCTFAVNVTATTVGTKDNTTGAVTSNQSGPGSSAAASVTVSAAPIPTLSGWAVLLLLILLATTPVWAPRLRRTF
jgi:PKD repeat protein